MNHVEKLYSVTAVFVCDAVARKEGKDWELYQASQTQIKVAAMQAILAKLGDAPPALQCFPYAWRLVEWIMRHADQTAEGDMAIAVTTFVRMAVDRAKAGDAKGAQMLTDHVDELVQRAAGTLLELAMDIASDVRPELQSN